jgi:hypothetical protein
MGMALAAVADDDDLLALDQVDVGVAIIINAHGMFRSFWCRTYGGRNGNRRGKSSGWLGVLGLPIR